MELQYRCKLKKGNLSASERVKIEELIVGMFPQLLSRQAGLNQTL